MSPKTRRHLFVSLVVIALALPAEGILLQALSSSSKDVIRTWVAGLSDSDLTYISHDLPSYPLDYRKAVMTRLTPEQRAAVWAEHVDRYVAAHPDLPSDALPVLGAIRSLLTAETFNAPSRSSRGQVAQLADQLASLIGKDETQYLLYRLGPRDGLFVSAAPLSHKLADRVRGWMVLLANESGCNCSTSQPFCGMNQDCQNSGGCSIDDSWPMCGWLWSEPCDGTCSTTRAS